MTDVSEVHEQVIANLHAAGLSKDLIASSLNLPATQVKTVILQLTNSPRPVLDEELAEDVRALASMAVREAKLILEFGTADAKMSVVKSMLSGLSRHVASSVGGEQEEARQAFTRVLEAMKVVPEMEPFVTEEGVGFAPVAIETTVTEDA